MISLDEIGELNIITEIFIRRRLMDQGKKKMLQWKRESVLKMIHCWF